MKQLRFGIVGGGIGSFIGSAHLHGAQMDGLAVLSAGCFSRDADKNREAGERWQVPNDRLYADYQEMAEAEGKRSDGIDFIIIATPNKTHYPIAKTFLEHSVHVSCDKPVAMNVEEALELQALSQEKGLHFGVSYTYVNYPLVHQMREMIDRGDIGKTLTVMAEYPQNWVIDSLNAENGVAHAWRFDRSQAGESAATADIGTHLTCLIERGTGLKIQKVLANLSRIPADMPLDTNTQVLLRLSGDVPGMLWASQVAIGHECSVSLRVFGDQGALEWSHDQPNRVKFTRSNGPEVWMTAGQPVLGERARSMTRIAAGHPEGFFEAFGCYYRGFCTEILHRKGETDLNVLPHPTIEDGIHSMRFVNACLQSQRGGNVWIDVGSVEQLINEISDAMVQELAPVPGEVMSLADIDRAIEELSKQLDLLMKETDENIMENVGRFKEISDQMAALKERRSRVLGLRAENDHMTRQLRRAAAVMEATPPEITEWDENIIHQLVEEARVLDKARILVRLKGGAEVEQVLTSQEAAA